MGGDSLPAYRKVIFVDADGRTVIDIDWRRRPRRPRWR